jgi:hypothetical protein
VDELDGGRIREEELRRTGERTGPARTSLPRVLSLSLCVGWDGVEDDEQRGPHATVAAAGSSGIPSYLEESGVDGKIA